MIRNIYKLNEDDSEITIFDKLSDIANNLGVDVERKSSDGASIIISDLCKLNVKFNKSKVTEIMLNIDNGKRMFDCSISTRVADNLATDIQTCILVCKDVHNKLMR